MKRVTPALALILATSLCISARTPDKLTPEQAKDHIGQTATICGLVTTTRYAESTRNSPTFLNFGPAYPKHVFTAIIWGSDRAKFGKPELEFKDKCVCVTGKVESIRASQSCA